MASANGTVLLALLVELQETRNLFELMISKPVHGYELDSLSGRCAMQIECAIHGGGATGMRLVWRKGC